MMLYALVTLSCLIAGVMLLWDVAGAPAAGALLFAVGTFAVGYALGRKDERERNP